MLWSSSAFARNFLVMHFAFDWDAQSVPHYVFDVYDIGTGEYRETGPNPVRIPITLHAETVETIFAATNALEAGRCGTTAKNIAKTGTKFLQILSDNEKSSCTFNYADDDTVRAAATTFAAIAETLQNGTRLQRLHRFDRLGLDAEINSLAEAVKDRRAIEVQNIAPTLQSIADDDRVMERVRRKAASLLAAPPP